MRIFPNIISADYDLWSEPVEEKKILINLPDGGKGFVRHRTLIVQFRHKRTQDKVIIRMTGRGNFYFRGTYYKKEEQASETTVLDTFKRLIGKDGEMAFRMAKIRLYME